VSLVAALDRLPVRPHPHPPPVRGEWVGPA